MPIKSKMSSDIGVLRNAGRALSGNTAITACICAILAVTIILVESLHDRLKEQNQLQFNAVIETTIAGLQTWIMARERITDKITLATEVGTLSRELLDSDLSPEEAINHPARLQLTGMFNTLLQSNVITSFYIINKDNINVLASTEDELGELNPLAYTPGLLDTFWSRSRKYTTVKLRPGLTIPGLGLSVSPLADFDLVTSKVLHNSSGEEAGLLIFYNNARTGLSSMISSTKFGDTGNVLAFWKEDTGAKSQGEAPPPGTAAGVTYSPLVEHVSEEGHPLVSASRWLPQLDMGVVAIENKAEAFSLYYFARNLLLTICAVAVVLLMIFYVVSVKRNRELQREKRNVERFFERSSEAQMICSTDGTILACNAASEELFHYTPDELINQKVSVVFPDFEDIGEYWNVVGDSSSSEQVGRRRELVARRSEGKPFPVQVSFSDIELSDNHVLLIYLRDITLQQEQQKQIEEQQRHINRILNHANINTWIFHSEADYHRANEEGIRFTGPSKAVLKTDGSALDYIPEPFLQQLKDLLQRCMETGQPFYLEHPSTYDSTSKTRWFATRGVAVRDEDGNITAVEGTSQNISERKTYQLQLEISEQALRDSEHHLRSMLDSSSSRIIARDLEGRITFINKAALATISLDENEVLGKKASDIYAPDVAKHIEQLDQQAIYQAQTLTFEENITQNGRKNYYYTSVIPLTDQDGNIFELLSWSNDITSMKEVQASLEDARQAADAANKAKSSFLATMSHEIRTPMNGVIGLIDIMRRSNLDDEQSQLVNTISDSSFALLGIIDDILDFSKAEAEKIELEHEPLSIESVVDSVGETLLQLAHKKDIDLITYCAPGLGNHFGDAVRIRQILFNIAGNAIKFTSTSDECRGEVVVTAEPHTNDNGLPGVKLDVKDNGIGIKPELQKKLFEPFIQAETSTTREFGGTGLGLSISKRLADMMGGDISLSSEIGIGSVFSVFLPLQPAEGSATVLPNLQQLGVMVPERAAGPSPYLESYLAQAGAHIIKFNESAPDRGLAARLKDYDRALVLTVSTDDNKDDESRIVADLRQKLNLGTEEDSDVPILLLSPGLRRKPRNLSRKSMQLDYCCLKREAFLAEIAQISGCVDTASDEIDDSAQEQETSSNGLDSSSINEQLVLVAEDNPTNQKVISHQLSLLGFDLEMADDGAQALQMWRDNKSKYWVLLTDCHMPNLDGYELTKSIRQEENGDMRLPIIALTADAIAGTKQACLEAGMDDYLSKPIQLEALETTMSAWLPKPEEQDAQDVAKDTAETAAAETGDASGPAENVVDTAALAELLGSDEPELLAEFYHEFLNSALPTVEEISEAIANEGHKQVSSLAHKLKSSAASVGANGLYQCCLQLESTGKTGGAGLREQGRALEAHMDQVKTWILDKYGVEQQWAEAISQS